MLNPDDCWGLESYKDFLLIPVKSSKGLNKPLETFGFIILERDLNLLFQDVSEYRSETKSLNVARCWIDLHLAQAEAL